MTMFVIATNVPEFASSAVREAVPCVIVTVARAIST